MANINIARIKAAYKLGCFSQLPLSQDQQLVYHPSITTCAEILYAIERRGDDGADIDQIIGDVDLHRNSAFQYCRLLEALGLLEKQLYDPEGKEGRPQNVYFAISA